MLQLTNERFSIRKWKGMHKTVPSAQQLIEKRWCMRKWKKYCESPYKLHSTFSNQPSSNNTSQTNVSRKNGRVRLNIYLFFLFIDHPSHAIAPNPSAQCFEIWIEGKKWIYISRVNMKPTMDKKKRNELERIEENWNI